MAPVNIGSRLAELIRQEVMQAGGMPPANLGRSSVLAHTGLDSLGFASLVVAMQKEFGLDPLGGSEDIVYPETFGDLLALYGADLDQAPSQ